MQTTIVDSPKASFANDPLKVVGDGPQILVCEMRAPSVEGTAYGVPPFRLSL